MPKITFQRLRIRRLSETIEDCIKDLILRGEIKPGDKLPSEKELSRQFGVSIVTVREALRGLEVFGFIEKKKGKNGGIFMREAGSDSVKIPLYSFLSLRQFSARHLTELREIIEPAAVRIAAPQISSYEIGKLERNVRYCEKKIEKVGDVFSERDSFDIEERNVEFHRLIAEATHNPVLALTVDYVMDFLFSFKKAILTPDIIFSTEIVKDHRNILARLREGDGEGGEREMLSHLRRVEKYLAKKEAHAKKQELRRPNSGIQTLLNRGVEPVWKILRRYDEWRF